MIGSNRLRGLTPESRRQAECIRFQTTNVDRRGRRQVAIRKRHWHGASHVHCGLTESSGRMRRSCRHHHGKAVASRDTYRRASCRPVLLLRREAIARSGHYASGLNSMQRHPGRRWKKPYPALRVDRSWRRRTASSAKRSTSKSR